MKNILQTDQWQDILLQIGLAGLALCAVLLLWYAMMAAIQVGSTARYAYVAKREQSYFKVAAFVFALSVGFVFFGLLAKRLDGGEQILFYFVGLVSFSLAFLVGYALEQYFKVYYPFFLEKKLRNIRFHPRLAPNGKQMKLLREHEEDVHMTQQMIADEESFTYDYDVWIEEESGYKRIERYDGHLHAIVCPRCEFRTLKDYKEVVMMPASATENGRLRKYYRCSYCGHEEMKDVDIASQLEEEELVHEAEFA